MSVQHIMSLPESLNSILCDATKTRSGGNGNISTESGSTVEKRTCGCVGNIDKYLK